MLDKVIFFVFALMIFVVIFAKMVKNRDSIYIYLLALNLVGIVIRFVEILNKNNFSTILVSICYITAIVIPLVVILLEIKSIYISEVIALVKTSIYLKLGQNNLARRKLIKYVDKHPNRYSSRKTLAQIYEKEGKFESAIDEYVIAVEINKKDYDSYYEIAFLLNKTEKNDEAIDMLENLLEKRPEYYKASELLGTIFYDQERFTEAVTIYMQALKYNPDKFELYYGLGMAYTRLNDFQTAKEYYEKAAIINSMLFHARVNIAQILLISGELEEAEQRFIQCLEDKESEPDAYFYLAIIAMLKGEIDRAIGYVNIAIELDKSIYKRVCKQDIFLPIMDQIRTNQTREHKYNLTYEEMKTKKHLDETISLINNLKGDARKRGYKGDSKLKELEQLEHREY